MSLRSTELMVMAVLMLAGVTVLSVVVTLVDVEKTEVAEITDIIQVSGGGFSGPEKCILEVDGVKGTYEGYGICEAQVGDKICEITTIRAWFIKDTFKAGCDFKPIGTRYK